MISVVFTPVGSSYSAAFSLSQKKACREHELHAVCATLSISADKQLLQEICKGYMDDKWIKEMLLKAKDGMPGIKHVNRLWYIRNRLIIHCVGDIRETLFQLAHNVLGHFGFDKTYGSLHDSFYWLNMYKELETAYVPSCIECQQNKSTTSKLISPLHPLPVPDGHGDSVAIDFIGPLPQDEGFNMIVMFTDHLGADVHVLPCTTTMTAEELADIFFNSWYCNNGLLLDIMLDRDKLFVSKFWKALHVLTGTKIKMSSSYHPETDGASKCTNKTVNQMLCYHVEHNQRGWVHAFPLVCFNIMNTINKSMGFSPFQLCMGHSPQVIPPLIERHDRDTTLEAEHMYELIKRLEQLSMEAQDNLLCAKISQAAQANKYRTLMFPFVVGGRVKLLTLYHRHEYQGSGEKRVAKFMPCYDRPYTIVDIDEEKSSITLDLPNTPNIFPSYHTSEVIPYIKNDATLFPNREFSKPLAITVEDGMEEYFICDIINEWCCSHGYYYLV